MSLRRRLALLICPELRPVKTIDLDALRARQETRRAAHPCLMQAYGPGRKTAYCVRCGETVSVARPEVCPARAPTREELGCEAVGFINVDAARRIEREWKAARKKPRPPLRQFPRVMIPFEAIRRCIHAMRFPTLSAGPELEKWLSQHVERLGGISCPSRLQRWQLGAARWLTEAPEPECDTTEDAPEGDPAFAGDDAELSALLRERPELDEADARRALERLGQRFPTPHGEPRPSHAGHVHHKSQGVR